MLASFLLNSLFLKSQNTETNNVNYRYSPSWWQTTINLPESPRKTLVGKNGQFMYEYPASISDPKIAQSSGFSTFISFETGDNETWKSQKLLNSRVPLVITQKEWKTIAIKEEAFAVAPLLFGETDSIKDYLGTSLSRKITGKPGNDMLIVTLENTGNTSLNISPRIKINTNQPVYVDTAKGKVLVADFLRIVVPYSIINSSAEPIKKTATQRPRNLLTLTLKPFQIEAGETLQLAFGVSQGFTAIDCPNNIQQALYLKRQSVSWWEKTSLPYNKIIVPDSQIQDLLNASVRNIYQVLDKENDLIALNTGPTSNRQFFISDAPFIADALTMLNKTEDAQKALDYMFRLQKSDGSFLQQEKDWKETGFVLWAISNYARLTGDKQWLETTWPVLEKGFNYLIELQKSTLQNEKAAYAGLLPPGSGSENQGIDYVNNYWALSGLNSAVTAARWASRHGQAIKMQSLYDEYYKNFLASTDKNMKKDSYGNQYLPVRETNDKKAPPQKSQWSFLNAVYPGKIFDLNHPIVTGNMKMLEKTVKEGSITNTGWINNSIVLASASDYAHALQWTGKAQEAANVMYALANHAAPNLAWYEQQSLKGAKDTIVSGDMPNSRISAEFIRLVRHLIVMERSYELHLFEGVPAAWTKPGMEIKLENILTEFGPLTLKLKFSDDGTTATLDMNLDSNNRRAPQRTLLHLDGIAGNPATIELELKPNLHKVFNLN